MRWTWVPTLVVAGLLTAQTPVAAADAEQIKQDVIALLSPAPGQEPPLSFSGVEVAPEGPGFKVTVNGLRTSGQDYLDIGTVTFNVEPKEGDLYAISNLDLPSSAPHRLASGGTDGGIDIGSERLNLTWSRPLQAVLALDAELRDVKVTDETGKAALTLGAVTAKGDSSEKSPGKWDQQGSARVENLVADAGPQGKFEVASLDFTTEARAADLAAWRGLMDRLQAMGAGAGGGEGGFAGSEASPGSQSMQDALKVLRDAGSLIGSYSTRVELGGMRFSDPSGAEMFTLAKAGLGFGLEGFDQEKSSVSFGYHHEGLSLAQPEMMIGADPALAKQLLPQELSLNIRAEDPPTRAIWTSFLDTAASAQAPDQMEMAMGMFMMSAQQTMLQSGAKLRVTDTKIVMPAAKAQIDGEVQADPGSPFGATGMLNLQITGLDTLISLATAAQVNPEEAQGMRAFFELLRGFSNRETGSNGAVVDRYALQLTKEGAVLLNGKDFSGFMGAMQGQQ